MLQKLIPKGEKVVPVKQAWVRFTLLKESLRI
jgi:hypothetical protein